MKQHGKEEGNTKLLLIFLLEEAVFQSTVESSRIECSESSNALLTAASTCTCVREQRRAAHTDSQWGVRTF